MVEVNVLRRNEPVNDMLAVYVFQSHEKLHEPAE